MNENKVRNLILKAKDSKIIAASKYADISSMIKLYNLGIHDFGENRVDSFLGKYNVLNGYNITWHFIGHLQRNKAKYVLGKIDYLHSLDSVLLLEYIERYCKKPLNCFIEVNISNDENKYGIKPYELEDFLTEAKKYSMVRIVGLMTILKNGLSHQEKMAYFKEISELSNKYNLPMTSFGMSSDYEEALCFKPTYVRLGSILFMED